MKKIILLVLTLAISAAGFAQIADSAKRHVVLQGAANFRDIGGYETKDGHHVKWNEIYRSADISKLRVTFYKTAKTTQADKDQFFGTSSAEFIIIVESGWYQRIKDTTLYIYEFHTEDFTVIDEVAGYYVSYKPVIPAQVHMIDDCVAALLTRNVELRFTPSLTRIADAIKASSLNYSIIRMRNAVK